MSHRESIRLFVIGSALYTVRATIILSSVSLSLSDSRFFYFFFFCKTYLVTLLHTHRLTGSASFLPFRRLSSPSCPVSLCLSSSAPTKLSRYTYTYNHYTSVFPRRFVGIIFCTLWCRLYFRGSINGQITNN